MIESSSTICDTLRLQLDDFGTCGTDKTRMLPCSLLIQNKYDNVQLLRSRTERQSFTDILLDPSLPNIAPSLHSSTDCKSVHGAREVRICKHRTQN